MKHIAFTVRYLIVMLTLMAPNIALSIEASIDELSAVYIYQLSRFTTWPETLDTQKEFNICFLAEQKKTEIAIKLEEQKIHGKKILIKYIKNEQQLQNCRVLYIDKYKNQSLIHSKVEKLLDAAPSYHVLTISNQKSFVKQKGIIELHVANNRLRYSINYPNSQSSKLTIDSRLFQLAIKIVR